MVWHLRRQVLDVACHALAENCGRHVPSLQHVVTIQSVIVLSCYHFRNAMMKLLSWLRRAVCK